MGGGNQECSKFCKYIFSCHENTGVNLGTLRFGFLLLFLYVFQQIFPIFQAISFPWKRCNRSADISNSKVSPSFLLHQVLYVLIFCFWSEEKANSGMSRSLTEWTFPFLSQKAQPPAPTHPRHAQACILAVEEPRTVSTASFQQPRHIHFWWRAPNRKTRELKIKSHHWQTFSGHLIKNYCSLLQTPADAVAAPPPQRVSNCFPSKHEFRV